MRLTRRTSGFLIGFGVWSWVIWPTFLKNIWADDRSWHDGPTGFFTVHLLLTVVSLALGTAIGWLGVRGWRAADSGATVGSNGPGTAGTAVGSNGPGTGGTAASHPPAAAPAEHS